MPCKIKKIENLEHIFRKDFDSRRLFEGTMDRVSHEIQAKPLNHQNFEALGRRVGTLLLSAQTPKLSTNMQEMVTKLLMVCYLSQRFSYIKLWVSRIQTVSKLSNIMH